MSALTSAKERAELVAYWKTKDRGSDQYLAAEIIEALSVPPEGGDTEAGEPQDARRYRWLNRQHNFLMYIEGLDETRTNVRLRCGLPLDEWIDNRIAEDAQRGPQEER